nr:MAG TPA: hypothetical protein [Caudoviricetes sp.]
MTPYNRAISRSLLAFGLVTPVSHWYTAASDTPIFFIT